MKTPAEARYAWIEALRSDKYKQCIGALEITDSNGIVSNCCLGVACRLFIEDGGGLQTEEKPLDKDKTSNKTLFDGKEAFLPNKVQSYLGINSTMGRLKSDSLHTEYLSILNDCGKTFAKIAQIIENNELDTLTDEFEATEPPNNSI